MLDFRGGVDGNSMLTMYDLHILVPSVSVLRGRLPLILAPVCY